MDWKIILLTSGITTALLSGIGFLIKEWFLTQIKESTAHEYKKSLEMFKSDIEWEESRKNKAAEISELFSLWLKKNYYEKEDNNHIRYELQKKYWEMALWIDEPILREINHAIDNSKDPQITHKKAMVSVRKLLLNNPNDGIKADEITHFNAL